MTWIPIGDSLPEVGLPVLVWLSDKSLRSSFCVAFRNDQGWQTIPGCWSVKPDHWRFLSDPLPAAMPDAERQTRQADALAKSLESCRNLLVHLQDTRPEEFAVIGECIESADVSLAAWKDRANA